ncbi:hypothetical protein Desor_2576 [Desulfosporosinus orientis DSM 765]|uniref:Uncharacterized protein n=1 Tax=Desulfosporosinus orientis (strain ATCC 19365 / DSM 765 / NCIMB 8382 / VKM B-1628 / Singapore I) TaxID=768706 RepID=G7W6C1_DESOD|nr:hypothetical protein [Desulfosporosinus orientis]AET68128.1 hypothetical protein Desor_2576 [Desulfosporosinus orientis DSM 765]
MQSMFMDANLAEDWPQDIEYLWLYESSPIEEVVDIEAGESWDIPVEEVHGADK